MLNGAVDTSNSGPMGCTLDGIGFLIEAAMFKMKRPSQFLCFWHVGWDAKQKQLQWGTTDLTIRYSQICDIQTNTLPSQGVEDKVIRPWPRH